jgi:hypothetical protein
LRRGSSLRRRHSSWSAGAPSSWSACCDETLQQKHSSAAVAMWQQFVCASLGSLPSWQQYDTAAGGRALAAHLDARWNSFYAWQACCTGVQLNCSFVLLAGCSSICCDLVGRSNECMKCSMSMVDTPGQLCILSVSNAYSQYRLLQLRSELCGALNCIVIQGCKA